jgi:hypothetical protein
MEKERKYKHLAKSGNYSISSKRANAHELDEAIEYLCGMGMNKSTIGRNAIILYAQDCGFVYEEQANDQD